MNRAAALCGQAYRDYVKQHWRQVRISEREARACIARGESAEQAILRAAGPAATIVSKVERSPTDDYFVAWVDVPSPEGMLF